MKLSTTLTALVCLSCACSSILCAVFENCAPDSDLGSWGEVSVLGCTRDDAACTLRRDKTVTITIDFAARKRIGRVYSSVHGIIGGLEMPFELKQPDACFDTGLSCPLSPGNHTYTYSLFVDHNKPKLRKVVVKWELLNELRRPIVCVLIPAKIR